MLSLNEYEWWARNKSNPCVYTQANRICCRKRPQCIPYSGSDGQLLKMRRNKKTPQQCSVYSSNRFWATIYWKPLVCNGFGGVLVLAAIIKLSFASLTSRRVSIVGFTETILNNHFTSYSTRTPTHSRNDFSKRDSHSTFYSMSS